MKTYSMLTSYTNWLRLLSPIPHPRCFLVLWKPLFVCFFFCGVGIIECLFNLLHYIINLVIAHNNENNKTQNLSATTRNYPQPQIKH